MRRKRGSLRGVFGLLAASAVVFGCGDGPDPDTLASLAAVGIDASDAQTRVFDLPEIVEAVPDARFGTELPETVLLYRVVDLETGPDGELYVANSGNDEILAVDETGALAWRSGRQGQGPGEFMILTALQPWRGDTLVAIDVRQRTASFWTADGQFARSLQAEVVPPEPAENVAITAEPLLAGVLHDGRLVVHGPERAYREGEPGMRRMQVPINLLGPEGTRSTTAHLPGAWMFELRTPGLFPVLPAPMSGGAAVAVSGERFAWASSDRYDVVIFEPDGRVESILRLDLDPEPVSDREREVYLADWSPWFPVEEAIPFRSDKPAFDNVFFSREGDVWARRYNWSGAPALEGPEEWLRFDLEGNVITRYRFPERVRIMAATRDVAYGVARDELDVERLVRFRL